MLARGLARGDKVVTAGAAELFGTEFGAESRSDADLARHHRACGCACSSSRSPWC